MYIRAGPSFKLLRVNHNSHTVRAIRSSFPGLYFEYTDDKCTCLLLALRRARSRPACFRHCGSCDLEVRACDASASVLLHETWKFEISGSNKLPGLFRVFVKNASGIVAGITWSL